MSNIVTFEIDIAHDCPIGDALLDIEKNKLNIVSFIAEGPGGGNPALTLSGPRENAIDFIELFEGAREYAIEWLNEFEIK